MINTFLRHGTFHYRGLQIPTVNRRWSLYFITITAVSCYHTIGQYPKNIIAKSHVKYHNFNDYFSFPVSISIHKKVRFFYMYLDLECGVMLFTRPNSTNLYPASVSGHFHTAKY